MGAIKTAIRRWMARRSAVYALRGTLNEWETLQVWGETPAYVHEFITRQQRRIHCSQNVEAELIEQRSIAMDLQMQVAVLETEVIRLRTSLALTGGGIA